MMKDVEKGESLRDYTREEESLSFSGEVQKTDLSWFGKFKKLIFENTESRGIERVPEDERTDDSLYSAASMWLSANMVIASYSLGALGTGIWGLGFYTALLTIIFFNLFGLVFVAFFSIFGFKFGLRQMMLSKYLVGNYGMRIFAFINGVACVGWSIVNTIASATLLHMVNSGSGHELPPWAGSLIITGLTVIVSFFGYRVIHTYEKYSWIPNFIVFLVIIARLAKSGNFTAGEWGSGEDTAANVLSFGGAIFGFATGWTTLAADYTVYMRHDTNSFKCFFSIIGGLAFPLLFAMILGAASITGINSNARWLELYGEHSIGGLIYAILVEDSLHGFGQFCCVVLALSTVSNNLPNMYSIGLCAQSVWSKFAYIPRYVWSLLGNAITLGVCIPAYYSFETVMENFMNMIGYYLAIYELMSLSEHFIYRRGSFKNYNIDVWNDNSQLPIGIAGVLGFCVGVAGVVLGISQVWYTGVIAEKIGVFGADIGFELGAGFAFVTFNVVRPIELKYFGR